MLQIGDQAPDFALTDKEGNSVKLSDFAGKKVVVYFYPKDDTPGCTKQACAFRDSYGEFEKRGITVIGISRDNAKSHTNFTQKFSLPFILLSDPDHKVLEAYGAWQEKNLYGKLGFGIVRSTFVINEDGKIIQVFPKANPDTNAADILASIQ